MTRINTYKQKRVTNKIQTSQIDGGVSELMSLANYSRGDIKVFNDPILQAKKRQEREHEEIMIRRKSYNDFVNLQQREKVKSTSPARTPKTSTKQLNRQSTEESYFDANTRSKLPPIPKFSKAAQPLEIKWGPKSPHSRLKFRDIEAENGLNLLI